jgi:hypothetical protein
VDSVDSHKERACPHYPQPYDDGDDPPLWWVGDLGTFPEEDHNKHSLKWYNFWGELPRYTFGTTPWLGVAVQSKAQPLHI